MFRVTINLAWETAYDKERSLEEMERVLKITNCRLQVVRDIAIGTKGLEVRREHDRHMGGEDITKRLCEEQ